MTPHFYRILFSGERPFACTFCDKTFVQRANYLKHSRWHNGKIYIIQDFITSELSSYDLMKIP